MRRQLPGGSNVKQQKMETTLGYLLLSGVVLSILLVIAGLTWHWAETSRLGIEYAVPKGSFFEFVIAEARQLLAREIHPPLLISLGVTALLLTPYFRVLASFLFFALEERSWKYSLFTGFVLAVLTYTLSLR